MTETRVPKLSKEERARRSENIRSFLNSNAFPSHQEKIDRENLLMRKILSVERYHKDAITYYCKKKKLDRAQLVSYIIFNKISETEVVATYNLYKKTSIKNRLKIYIRDFKKKTRIKHSNRKHKLRQFKANVSGYLKFSKN